MNVDGKLGEASSAKSKASIRLRHNKGMTPTKEAAV